MIVCYGFEIKNKRKHTVVESVLYSEYIITDVCWNMLAMNTLSTTVLNMNSSSCLDNLQLL